MKNSFDKIVGYEEEKRELQKYSYILKNKKELLKLGGKMPKGLLLVGPNGVGKTVLAKSLIKESGCECIEINLDKVISKGEISSVIKEKFLQASSLESAILFIDEFDKFVGREKFFFSESNELLSNIILNELNRYNDSGIFFLAVSNEKKIIDESLIRSGRIDSIVEINKPNEEERIKIVDYYLKDKKVLPNVNSTRLARLFNGYSGADIESTINNALIKCFVEKRNFISEDDIVSVYYDKKFKTLPKENKIDNANNELVATHEAGHVTINLLLDKESINQANILTRNEVQGCLSVIERENQFNTIDKIIDKVKVYLGGRLSEEIVEKKISVGASNDLGCALAIISGLVRTLGYAGLEYLESPMTGESFCSSDTISEEKLIKIEKKESEILSEIYEETKKLINENVLLVKMIRDELLKKKVLNKDELLGIYDEYLLKKTA